MRKSTTKNKSKIPTREFSLKHLTLQDIVLLSLSVVFLIIGIDQMVTIGFTSGYWSMMLALIFFFVYNLRRRKR
jgi:amino acid permease